MVLGLLRTPAGASSLATGGLWRLGFRVCAGLNVGAGLLAKAVVQYQMS